MCCILNIDVPFHWTTLWQRGEITQRIKHRKAVLCKIKSNVFRQQQTPEFPESAERHRHARNNDGYNELGVITALICRHRPREICLSDVGKLTQMRNDKCEDKTINSRVFLISSKSPCGGACYRWIWVLFCRKLRRQPSFKVAALLWAL